MTSKKDPKLLSDRQIRRKVAQEKNLFDKEVEEILLKKYRKSHEVNVEGKKVNNCKVSPIDESEISNEKAYRDILLSYLSKSHSEENCEKSFEDVEVQLSVELSLQNPEEVINEILSNTERNDNANFDFFNIITKLVCDNDSEDDEGDVHSDYEYAAYLDELKTLDEKDPKVIFINSIRALCIKYIHTIPHVFINELLQELRKETGYPFPKDARTFLKTPRETVVHKVGIGRYCNYGIESAIRTFLAAYKKERIDVDCVRLIANIDGAFFAKSSEDDSWIISVSETRLNLVEVTGIYDGIEKPEDSDKLMHFFVHELTGLINTGVLFEGKMYKVILHCIVCDAPAKAYVFKTKLHSGYYSCSKCTIKGDYLNKVIFPTRMQQAAVLRTDEEFLNQDYERNKAKFDQFQLGESVMKKIPNFRPITDVVLDYMHLICLGVMTKLIELWIQNPKVALSEYERKKISDRLLSYKENMPSDFSRNPRHFQNVRRFWKAHELRSFLLYTGPIVTYNILPSDLYLNFLCLHVAIAILVNPVLCQSDEYLNYSENLLIQFVNSYEKLYGEINMVFNIHNFLHLVNDVRRFGPLDNFSAFGFENHIRKVKQLIRKGDKRLEQIANRIIEIRESKEYHYRDDTEETNFLLLPKMQPFEIVRRKSFKIDCRNNKDKYVLLDDGTYFECRYFIKREDGQVLVVGHPFKTVQSFYEYPMSSSLLNINIIERIFTNQPTEIRLYQSILAKICTFPLKFKGKFVAVPIIHTYNQN